MRKLMIVMACGFLASCNHYDKPFNLDRSDNPQRIKQDKPEKPHGYPHPDEGFDRIPADYGIHDRDEL